MAWFSLASSTTTASRSMPKRRARAVPNCRLRARLHVNKGPVHGPDPAHECAYCRPRRRRTFGSIGVAGGKIAAIEPSLVPTASRSISPELVTPPFVETHIHLDKSNILDRCVAQRAISRSNRRGGQCQACLHARRRLHPCKTHARSLHIPRRDAYADPSRGRSGIRLRSLEGILPLIDRIQMGDRCEDMHLSAGGAAQQSRHRRTDGGSAQAWRNSGRSRALYRLQSAWANRSRVRNGARIRPRYRHAPSISRRRRTTWTWFMSANWPRNSNMAGGSPSVMSPRCRRHRPSCSPSARAGWPMPVLPQRCCHRPICT